jgi:hypothetical protein
MSTARSIRRYAAALAAASALSLVPQMAGADVQPPPAGTPPSQFATQDPGCLGPLRRPAPRPASSPPKTPAAWARCAA